MGFHTVKASEQQSVEIGIADTKRVGEQKAVQSRPSFAAKLWICRRQMAWSSINTILLKADRW